MFSTMPSLSSVWNVKADVGGDLGEEAGVGVAVGVERLLAVRANLRTRNLAEDAQPFAGVVVEQPARLGAALRSVVGSIARMRMAWMSSLA